MVDRIWIDRWCEGKLGCDGKLGCKGKIGEKVK